MSTKVYNLNMAHFGAVPTTLRQAADEYRESASELASAWQDESAGAIWNDYARILERAADAMDKAQARRGIK